MNQQEVIDRLLKGQLDWKNFSPNNSALGYDADVRNFMNYMGRSAMGYDADARNWRNYDDPFQIASSMTPEQLRAYLSSQVNSGAMTTFRMRVYYTAGPGPGAPEPVDITFFDSTFQVGGVFDIHGNLVFTNTNGDTATIEGLTTNGPNGRRVTIQQLYNTIETEPAVIGFIRLKVKTTAQFDYSMGIIKDGQYGGYGGNSITPDDYVDPDQFQLLRVDVPMNVKASKRDGFSWTIDEDQTGTGIGMTLFIPKTLDPGKQLDGKDPVRNLNMGVDPAFYTPMAPSTPNPMQNLVNMAKSDAVKQIMSSGIKPEMGQQMIQSIAPQIIGGPLRGIGL